MSTKTTGVMFMADSLGMPDDFKPLGEFLADEPKFVPPAENEDLITPLMEPVEISYNARTLAMAEDEMAEDKTYLMARVSPDGKHGVAYPCKAIFDGDGGITFEPARGPVNAETIVIQEQAEQR